MVPGGEKSAVHEHYAAPTVLLFLCFASSEFMRECTACCLCSDDAMPCLNLEREQQFVCPSLIRTNTVHQLTEQSGDAGLGNVYRIAQDGQRKDGMQERREGGSHIRVELRDGRRQRRADFAIEIIKTSEMSHMCQRKARK